MGFSEQTTSPNPTEAVPQTLWRRWIFAFSIYTIAANTSLTSAIWMIYLTGCGYNPFVIGLLEMLFHITKFLAEVPTGIFADLLGRRKSLIIFCIISALQGALFLHPTLPLMILSFALSGVAFAFRGGADSAILWTIAGHIKPKEQSNYYSKLYTSMFVLSLIGEVIGTATGGFLGKILTILPFVIQIFISLAGIVPLLWIPEQRFAQEGEQRVNPFSHFTRGIRIVWQKPIVMGLIILNALAESCWQTIYFYYQLYLHNAGTALEIVGIVVAVGLATSALFTAIAPWFMRHIARRILIPGCMVLEVLGLLLMSTPWLALSLFGYLVFFQASVSILGPAASTYINEHSPEQQRATILSFSTGLFSASMIVMFPLFGAGVSNVSYTTVFSWMLIALVTGSLAILGLTLRRQRAISLTGQRGRHA